MATTSTRSRKRCMSPSLGGRLTRLLAHQSPETLAQLEGLMRSREGPPSGAGGRSPFNLTIEEVALLNSFRRLPDEASRDAVARGVAAFQRFATSAKHEAILRRADLMCGKVRSAAR